MAAGKTHISAGADERGIQHTWCCRTAQEKHIDGSQVLAAALGFGYQDLHDACAVAGCDCKVCRYNFARANTRRSEAKLSSEKWRQDAAEV